MQAATLYHQPPAEMELVAWRESRDEASAVNGSCLGLFQIQHPGIWDKITINGRTLRNPYAAKNPYSAKWNALSAGWLWAHGLQDNWSTYP